MATEEKAKAYDEALERAEDCLTDRKFSETDDTLRSVVEYIFPELAKSENERIREAIESIIRVYGKTKGEWIAGYDMDTLVVHLRNAFAYLEKQKEQKWSPSEGEMGVLYKLCYLSNQITDEDDTELTRLYQDLKREYFNGHSFENMFPSEKQKEQKPLTTEETELNSIAFLEQVGYTCIPPRKEQKPAQTAEEKEYVRTLKGLISDFIRDCGGGTIDTEYYQKICNWLDGRHIEQNPAESISQLTVQGKGVYKICPRCKERMIRDDSMVYTSMPPQYRYECPKCGEMEFDTVMYDNPENEEQKPVEWKPQPESLEALMYAIEGKWDVISPTSYLSRRLEDLYEGLVNTYNVDESLLAELPKAASRAYTAEDIDELRELKRKIEASMEQKQQEEPDKSLEEAAKTNAKINMTRTKLELNEIETLTHLVRARAVEPGHFQGLYKNILSRLNKMFDEEYAGIEKKEEEP